jgi:hypothetical protein
MWSFSRSRRHQSELESTLRENRPRPRSEFAADLASHVDTERHTPQRTAWSRLAFAGAFSTVILGLFASFGGLTYAASGASSSYSVVKQTVVQHKLSVDVRQSSASSQYYTPPKTPPRTSNVAGASTGAGAVAGADTLPFTGISLLVTALLGTAMLVTGLILRRRERRES